MLKKLMINKSLICLKMTSIFTSVLDVDILILLALNEKSLFLITQVNKNIRNTILKELPLRKKFINYNLIYKQAIKEIRKRANYAGQVDVRIIGLNTLSTQEIVALLPNVKNIKFEDFGIKYTIHANQVIDSLEKTLVQLNRSFNLNHICACSNNILLYLS